MLGVVVLVYIKLKKQQVASRQKSLKKSVIPTDSTYFTIILKHKGIEFKVYIYGAIGQRFPLLSLFHVYES